MQTLVLGVVYVYLGESNNGMSLSYYHMLGYCVSLNVIL